MPRSDEYEIEQAKLRQENATLRAERDYYRELALPKLDLFPLEWGLSKSETIVLEALYGARRGRVALKEHIYGRLYVTGGEAALDIIDVYVCKIRRKLEPHGIEIDTVWGRGYTLPDESRALIDSAVNGTLRFAPQPRADLHA